MRKPAAILFLIGLFGLPPAGSAFAQSPIGLYGQWSSSVFPGASGQIQLADIAVSGDGVFVGRVFFTGSPCAIWANFSGRLYGDTAVLSMYVGSCGLTEVTLHRVGNAAWSGSYRSAIPDAGMVQMVQ
jgi:hypothetical protein